MTFLISTTGAGILVADLGAFFPHPTVDRDLSLEFSVDEISASTDLTAAISSGQLILKLGNDDYTLTQVDGYYYTPYLALEKSLSIYELTDKFVTIDELGAANKNKVIYPGVFPVQVSSTTAFTKTVICNSAFFETWTANAGDVVVITGGLAAGTYTIDSVDSQTQFTVIESISNSISTGTLAIYHPTGASTVGFDPSGLANVTSTTVQGAITQLDAAVTGGGLTATQHENLDTLVHELSENFDGYQTKNSDGIFTQVEFKNSVTGFTVRKALNFTSNSDGLITGFTVQQYNNLGSLMTTIDVSVDPLTGTHSAVKS